MSDLHEFIQSLSGLVTAFLAVLAFLGFTQIRDIKKSLAAKDAFGESSSSDVSSKKRRELRAASESRALASRLGSIGFKMGCIFHLIIVAWCGLDAPGLGDRLGQEAFGYNVGWWGVGTLMMGVSWMSVGIVLGWIYGSFIKRK